MIQINALGDACPIPVVKAMNAMKELGGSGVVEIMVDNEIAVENLTKLAKQKSCAVKAEQLAEDRFRVTLTVGDAPQESDAAPVCAPDPRGGYVVAVASDKMGSGDDELGATLMKGFLYALSQQDVLPTAILFYNGGAKLTVEGAVSVEDLRSMEEQGVEILTCGTCLNFYGLTEKLAVGSVTNMYTIVEKLTAASKVVKP